MNNKDWHFMNDNRIYNYRSAGVLIYEGKILIQRGTNDTVFALPGGHVKWGETNAEAVIREYKEETGADVTAERLLWIDESFWQWGERKCHTVCFYHLLSLKDINQIPMEGTFYSQKDNDASLIFTWVELSQISSIETYPVFLKDKVNDISDYVEHFICRE